MLSESLAVMPVNNYIIFKSIAVRVLIETAFVPITHIKNEYKEEIANGV